jgi:hypothetical protein
VDPGAREIPVGQIPTSSVKEAESVALNETMSFKMGMEYALRETGVGKGKKQGSEVTTANSLYYYINK